MCLETWLIVDAFPHGFVWTYWAVGWEVTFLCLWSNAVILRFWILVMEFDWNTGEMGVASTSLAAIRCWNIVFFCACSDKKGPAHTCSTQNILHYKYMYIFHEQQQRNCCLWVESSHQTLFSKWNSSFGKIESWGCKVKLPGCIWITFRIKSGAGEKPWFSDKMEGVVDDAMMPCRLMEVHKLECHDVCMIKCSRGFNGVCNIHLFAVSFLFPLNNTEMFFP